MESKKIDGNEETDTDFVNLFNGNLDGWKMIGNGSFAVIFEDGDDRKQHPLLKTQGGMGLLWHYKKKFKDFILMLEWRVTHIEDNSGIFVGFSNPQVILGMQSIMDMRYRSMIWPCLTKNQFT